MSIVLTPELEDRIASKVRSGVYRSPSEVVEASLDLLEFRDREAAEIRNGTDDHDSRLVWERIVAIGQAVPREAWDAVPGDLSTHLDHYLYGAAKVESEMKSD